ncbi:MAG: DUF2027 domain-containing protein, partial [Bacteroidales bacterium]|nr:DUF2027 domain-containing protein [Bacteroidales bacterium]
VKSVGKDGMIMVVTENGFEYPMPADQLVLINKATIIENILEAPKPQIKEKPKHQKHLEKPEKPKDDRVRFSMAFTQENTGVAMFNLHIINDSEYDIMYQVLKQDDLGLRTLSYGNIEAGYIDDLNSFTRDDINNLKKLQVQALFIGSFGMKQRKAFEKTIKLEPSMFFVNENFVENDYFEELALIFDLINEHGFDAASMKKLEDLQEMLANKETPEPDKSSRYKARKQPETIEVDLHINSLVDNVRGMSNAEILDYQMQYFHKTLTDAMHKKAVKIVFIHGIGNGTLRDKLRESLAKQYKLDFQDASFKEYGFGATMVFLMS